ncbi:MAG: efflux RND transporter periplasmic adaptor subunit, partial [Bradyrhizobium sp.]|nr:efflux RND transporter periplasmic adaptor subunit [Bradyrhizobium sp.]
PLGTFSYVIGEGNVVTAKPVVVTQQNETDAVISSGLTASDRVVTTGFANLSDGAKVIIGKEGSVPAADLAPRKRSRGPDAKGKDGAGERPGKKGEGDQKGQTGPAPAEGSVKSGSGAKSPP